RPTTTPPAGRGGLTLASTDPVVEQDRPEGRVYWITFAAGTPTSTLTGDGSLLKASNEVQRIQVFNANGGAYSLTYVGQATGIAYNASSLSNAQITSLTGATCPTDCEVTISRSARDYTVPFGGTQVTGKALDQNPAANGDPHNC